MDHHSQGLNTEEKILELLWDSLKRDPEHKDRRQTGWGTKTKQGLCACIYRISKEHFGSQRPAQDPEDPYNLIAGGFCTSHEGEL